MESLLDEGGGMMGHGDGEGGEAHQGYTVQPML